MQTYLQPNCETTSQQNFYNKTFHIIHPFHPLKNISFEVCAIRKLPSEWRLFYFNQKGNKTSVALEWTDIAPPDPYIVVSAGRALFRVEDLLRLMLLQRGIRKGGSK
jgi:hypothetical protein